MLKDIPPEIGNRRVATDRRGVEVETLDLLETVSGVDKPTAEPKEPVYGSCEEAKAAGEQRT